MKSEKTDIVIHVGLHKTGTTFLQRQVFPYIQDIHFVDKEESIRFDMKLEKNKINLISNEDLSGDPWGGDVGDRFQIAQRLKGAFPDARIIVGTREKNSWIKSLYKNYVRKGGIYDFDDFMKYVFSERRFNYNEYIDFLKELFNDIHVYDFSELKKDSVQFVKDICDFIGCIVPDFDNKKRNVAWNQRQIKLGLFLNRLWYNERFNPNGKIRIRPKPRFIVSILNGETY